MNDGCRDFLSRNAQGIATVVANGAGKRLAAFQPDEVIRAFRAVRDLSGGQPCDYSLPAIGPMYSLFFHGRRLHDALWFLDAVYGTLRPAPGSLVRDYGTGTGAVAWSIACRQMHGCPPYPADQMLTIQIDDTSTLMLQEAEHLWADLCKAWSGLAAKVRLQVTPANPAPASIAAPSLICAGYVLGDPSTATQELTALLSYADRHNADRIGLWTSDKKVAALDATAIANRGWRVVPVTDTCSSWGFLNSASNNCAGACWDTLVKVIDAWPDDQRKTDFKGEIQWSTGKFWWTCTRPQFPLVCLARLATQL